MLLCWNNEYIESVDQINVYQSRASNLGNGGIQKWQKYVVGDEINYNLKVTDMRVKHVPW